MSRCTGTTKSGERCKVEGHLVDADGLCPMHADPTLPSRAGKLGAAESNRIHARKGIDPDDLPDLTDHQSVKDFQARVSRAVALGDVSYNDGRVALDGSHKFRLTLEGEATLLVVTQLKARIEELEAELRRAKVKAVR